MIDADSAMSPIEKQILAEVRDLVKKQKYEDAKRLLLTISDNETAQKWLLRMEGIVQINEKSSNPYQVPSQFKPTQIRCQQCQLQLGKEAIKCKQRRHGGCLYEHKKGVDIDWRQIFWRIVFALNFGAIAAYSFLLASEEWPSLLSIFNLLLGGFIFFVVIIMLLGMFPKVDKLYNQQTGEKWQNSATYGVTYRPIRRMPGIIKNSPKLKRTLSYPASSAILYDPQLVGLWQSGLQDIASEELAYVLLSIILHLMSAGYLQIWFAPTYRKQLFGKDLQRQPNNDFNFTLTDLGETTKFLGKTEQKIKKFCKSSYSGNHHWLPGAELISMRSVFDSSGVDRQKHTTAEVMRLDRLAALQGLLKGAGKIKGVVKQNGRYRPNPELEPLFKQDAVVLAQLVQDYYEMDTDFVTTLQKRSYPTGNLFSGQPDHCGPLRYLNL